jgi:hypothetical protein
MNIYVVAEGPSEKKIYSNWIPAVNNLLSLIESVDAVYENNFYIIHAGGYPAILQAIENAIEDIREYPQFTRLVISVDSDELSREDKFKEMFDFINEKKIKFDVRIIVQHFCLETWALGNKRIIRAISQNAKLIEYRKLFDVREQDPELLPALEKEQFTRSQFAKKYLRLMINDRRNTMSYSVTDPSAVTEITYYEQVKRRYEITHHLDSFSAFLSAFV